MAIEVAAESTPHPRAAMPTSTRNVYVPRLSSILPNRKKTAIKMSSRTEKCDSEKSPQNRLSAYAATRTPAANGKANPAISLSTFI